MMWKMDNAETKDKKSVSDSKWMSSIKPEDIDQDSRVKRLLILEPDRFNSFLMREV